jgi:EpsI family protein
VSPTAATRLAIVAAVVVATTGYLRLLAASDVALPAPRLASLPLAIGEWRGRDEGRLDPETEAVLHANAYTLRTYARSETPVSLFVAYYATQRAGQTIHSPLNCLPGNGWNWVERERQQLRADSGRDIEVNRNLARNGAATALVYYWYQSHGRTIASDYTNRLVLMYDALARHRSDGALVRVVAPAAPGDPQPAREAESFIRAVYGALTDHLPE